MYLKLLRVKKYVHDREECNLPWSAWAMPEVHHPSKDTVTMTTQHLLCT